MQLKTVKSETPGCLQHHRGFFKHSNRKGITMNDALNVNQSILETQDRANQQPLVAHTFLPEQKPVSTLLRVSLSYVNGIIDSYRS